MSLRHCGIFWLYTENRVRRTRLQFAINLLPGSYSISLSLLARPLFLLAAVFFLRTPFETAPSITEQVSGNMAVAAALSPLSTTARNFFMAFLTWVLTILFLIVFFSVTRTRFFADFMLGTSISPLSVSMKFLSNFIIKKWHCKLIFAVFRIFFI